MAETHGLNVRLSNCRKQTHPHPSSSGFRSKSRLVVTVEDHSAIHLQNPYFCDAFATTQAFGERKISDALSELWRRLVSESASGFVGE
jgi:hypothetical protein